MSLIRPPHTHWTPRARALAEQVGCIAVGILFALILFGGPR